MYQFLTFALSLVLLSSQSAVAKSQLVVLKAANPVQLAEYLEQRGYDIGGHNTSAGEVSVITDFPFLLDIEKQNLPWDSEDLSFQVETIEETEPYLQYSARAFGDATQNYWGPDEALKEIQALAAKYPQLAKVYNLNDFLGTTKTVEGQSIYALHISSNPGKIEDKPKLLFNGQHHARELMTQHVVIDGAKDLLDRVAKGDADAKLAVDKLSIWFVPVVNPDGLRHVLTKDRLWRKNRAFNPGGTRGVDLNRNYSVKWGACGIHSPEEDSEVYKGENADSEAEVKVLEALNHKLHFHYSISYHSYGNEVLYPYLCGHLAESVVYYDLRDKLKNALGFGHRLPSSGGEDHEYHYNKLGSLAFLLEIGDQFQPSFSTYEKKVWPTVKKVLPLITKEALTNHVEFRVVDAATGKPIQANLKLAEVAYREGETRSTDSFGVHRWRLPAGNYRLTVETNGYGKQEISVEVKSGIQKISVPLRSNFLSLQGISNWLQAFQG